MARRPPPELVRGGRGRRLWLAVIREFDLDDREMVILAEAAATLDRIDGLNALVEADGPMVPGSAGQPVLHPALGEQRQQRVVLARLLGQLDLPAAVAEPAEGDGVVSITSKLARRAARARWRRRYGAGG